jgi:HK97 family phage portal protein
LILNIFKTLQKVFRFHPRNPSYWAQKFWGGIESKSGISIDEETAMKYTVYYAGIRIIAETIASLPLNIYKRLDKGKEKDTKHPLYYLLHDQPNEDMTSFDWRETAKVHLLGWGNHYSLIKKNPLKRYVEEIYPMVPWRVKPEIVNTSIGRVKVYRYMPEEGDEIVLNKDNVLHIHGLSYDGLVGKSPLGWYREAIGLGLAMEEYSSRFFSNGLNAGGIFTTPQVLKHDTYERLKKELKKNYSGLGKTHGTMLLEQDMKFDKLSINPDDAQLLESKRFQVEEIARILRIPLHLLQNLDKATFSNIEQQGINFVVYCIRPWLVRDEQSYNMQLLPEDEKGKYFIEYVVDGLLRGDTKTRWEAYKMAIQNGVYSPNDVLELENMNPYSGGDKHFIQLNMQTVEDVGKLTDGSRELIINGNEVRIIPKEAEAIDGRVLETEIRGLTPELVEKLGKAYSPLFLNALIRITKREKTDLFKMSKNYLENKDSEKLKNSLKDFFSKHEKFVLSQIKPPVYAFTEALGADLEERDITIFADEYSNDFTERYIDDISENIKTIGSDDFEETYSRFLEDRPEELSNSEVKRIQKAINKYIEKI